MFQTAIIVLFSSVYAALPLHFVSSQDIVDAVGVQLEVQNPTQGITLATKDPARPKLWYMPVSTHANDEAITIWYQRVDNGEKEYADQRTLCVGELRGEQWTLPSLGDEALPWGGPNNVCMRRSPFKPTWGGFNVFQIVHDDRFRMLYWDQPSEKAEAGAMLAESRDGRVWETDLGGAVFTEHNDAFTLLPKSGRYLLYQTALEDWPDKPYPDNLDKKRRIQTIRESRDLRVWTPQRVFLRPDQNDPPETEFYLMKAFAYGGRYLGLLMKYYADPALPNRHSAIIKNELIVSDDALAWERPFREVDLGFWSYADPFESGGRLHFVAWKDNGMQTVCYTPGRMVCVRPTDETGAFLTRPFVYPKDADGWYVDADASAGWVDIEVRRNDTVAGHTRIEGKNGRLSCSADDSARAPKFEPAETYQLRITLHNAKLFSVGAVPKKDQ